jgi:transcription-repair coupling factor (superfamily II helicase)
MMELKKLIPEADIRIAHGQMSKEELEDTMDSFINNEFDILLCTTIIETGIDIPNVNTLIIYDAERFGLSQLYQIRGRVGRSNKIAYAYLMYNKSKILTDVAVKRLNVIKEFTELGSGFSIATRDLSIRGAGDILGSEQAGFIDNIGIELYLKILNEEIAKLKGETVEEEETKDEKPLLNVETHIDDKYVEDTELKIEIHKKINEINSYEKLLSVKKEIEDRFGKLDEKVIIYMYEEWFESLAKKLEIEEVHQTKNSIELIFSEEMSNKIDGEKLFTDAFNISRMIRFQMKSRHLILILDTIKLEENYIYILTKMLDKIVLKDDKTL